MVNFNVNFYNLYYWEFNVKCYMLSYQCSIVNVQLSVFNYQYLIFIIYCSMFNNECSMSIESFLWWDEGYTEKYSLSLWKILRAKPEGFPEGTGYISSYIPTWVTIDTFSITTSAVSFLEINIGRVYSPYCSISWAIQENIAQ